MIRSPIKSSRRMTKAAAKAPVMLTKLRKDAIAEVLLKKASEQSEGDDIKDERNALVGEAFEKGRREPTAYNSFQQSNCGSFWAASVRRGIRWRRR